MAICVSVLCRHGLWLQQPQCPSRRRRFAPCATRPQQYFLRPIWHGQIHADQCHLGRKHRSTGDISTALDSGKHTTTHAQLYQLDAETQLIDSPGLQAFGLHHLERADLLHYFPDLRHLIGQCRFHNCTHRNEPNCVVKNAAESGDIAPHRLHFLQTITDELSR